MNIIHPPVIKPLKPIKIFLAGTIDMGSSFDWQSKLANEDLKDYDVIFYNPRRPDWDASWKQKVTDKNFVGQVIWELDGLDDADIIVMHLSEGSQSPISLLELGLYVRSDKMIVFSPDGFYRQGNVDIVCDRFKVPVFENYDEFLKKIKLKIVIKQIEFEKI